MNRSAFQTLARLRLREARGLFGLKLYSGAYYLAGYAVECALKACISRQTQRFEFPDKERVIKSYSHSPKALLQLAGLTAALQQDIQTRPALEGSWGEASNWTEQSRYMMKTRTEASALLDAVGKVPDGVLPWIKQHW